MGKGDVKSKRGKIWRGSYGNSRKRTDNEEVSVAATAKPEAKKPAKARK